MNDALGAPQSVLVLGGGSEIAATIVDRLVARRCRRVILAARHPEAAVDAIRERLDPAVELSGVVFDAADTGSHAAAMDVAFADGDIDLVIVAFGVLGSQEAFRDDPEAAVAAVHVNYTGSVSACLVVARHLRRQGHGTIAVLSSVAGERARRDNYVYGSSKAGLDAFAQGLGDDLVGDGCRVMVVRPGFVHSKMTDGLPPAPFSTTPDTVAEVVIRGLEREQDIVWAPPILRWVFVVMRHLPRRVWRKVSAR